MAKFDVVETKTKTYWRVKGAKLGQSTFRREFLFTLSELAKAETRAKKFRGAGKMKVYKPKLPRGPTAKKKKGFLDTFGDLLEGKGIDF